MFLIAQKLCLIFEFIDNICAYLKSDIILLEEYIFIFLFDKTKIEMNYSFI